MANKKHLRKFCVKESILVRVAKCGYYHTAQLARKRLFVWLSYSLSNRDKVGHKKRINKVLLTVRRYAD